MPAYKYTATTLSGRKKSGRESAPDAEQLRERLREKDLLLIGYSEAEDTTRSIKLRATDISDFCRQLGSLLSAGVPLIRAMIIISQRDANPKIKNIYAELIRALQQGMPLSDALAAQNRAFPELLVSMFRSAENSGNLDTTALRMAEHYDKEHRLRTQIKSASTYPIILLVLTVVVILALFTFILPRFMPMFEGMELPWSTQFLMNASDAFKEYWIEIGIGVVAVILLVNVLFQLPKMRIWLDKMKLKLPKVGKLLRIIYTSRFARTLASLYVSGIPMIQSLTIARSTVGNAYIESQFQAAITALATGSTLSQAIGTIDGFEGKLISTMRVGEESGRLEHMLESVSDSYDYEAAMATQQLVTMLEPIMIIIMAAIVAFVMISVLTPIWNFYGTLNG